MLSLGRRLPVSGSGCHLPTSLPPAGDGPVHRQLALLWYSLRPLLCEWAQQCLRLELFIKFSLSPTPLSFFLSLAISQFGLLSHISSRRLSSGHSGLVFTLSNVACTSVFNPPLLVANARVWASSPLGVAVRHIICGFYLFIFSS